VEKEEEKENNYRGVEGGGERSQKSGGISPINPYYTRAVVMMWRKEVHIQSKKR